MIKITSEHNRVNGSMVRVFSPPSDEVITLMFQQARESGGKMHSSLEVREKNLHVWDRVMLYEAINPMKKRDHARAIFCLYGTLAVLIFDDEKNVLATIIMNTQAENNTLYLEAGVMFLLIPLEPKVLIREVIEGDAVTKDQDTWLAEDMDAHRNQYVYFRLHLEHMLTPFNNELYYFRASNLFLFRGSLQYVPSESSSLVIKVKNRTKVMDNPNVACFEKQGDRVVEKYGHELKLFQMLDVRMSDASYFQPRKYNVPKTKFYFCRKGSMAVVFFNSSGAVQGAAHLSDAPDHAKMIIFDGGLVHMPVALSDNTVITECINGPFKSEDQEFPDIFPGRNDTEKTQEFLRGIKEKLKSCGIV